MLDNEYLEKKFYATMGYSLDLNNPQTFNEKLQWLKLYDRKPEYTVMVDKYLVKQYVAEKIGEEYIIPTLGVWDNAKDIDFDKLPNRFVLKCNHNSGTGMYICKDKSRLTPSDIKRIRKNLQKGLKQDYYLTGREWPYKDVPRKIIAEKFLEDKKTGELRDYKFFCFNGGVKCFKIDFDRFIDHRANYFDVDGNLLETGETVCPPDFARKIEMPKNLKAMLDMSEKLSKNIAFNRVDFYECDDKMYFGELTFYPNSGFGEFIKKTTDLEMGTWIELPKNSGGGYLINGEGYSLWIHSEEMLSNVANVVSSNGGLTDYKFFCFNGVVDCVMLCLDRESGDTKFYFFDREWNLLRYNKRGILASEDFTVEKPKHIDKMFDIAGKLSEGLPFVRVDLYNVNEQILFGELTFFPDSGFDPNLLRETDIRFGNLIRIGEIK